MTIDSYSFGCMVIDGQPYDKDLIILPDSMIVCPWWRKTGHTLSITDLQDVIAASPQILIVGTGKPGFMKPEKTLKTDLAAKGIDTRIMSTGRAVKEFNALRKENKSVAACFHLTC